jgi:hypothetical protein
MRYVKLLTSVICLLSVFVLVEKAHGFAWYGFSELCYEGEFKGPEGSELRISLINFTVEAQCYNTSTGDDSCQPGTGNFGTTTISVTPTSNPDKERGTLYVTGCIDLSRYDNHDANDHIHICTPLDNKNKVEFLDSAWVPKIDVVWELINLANGNRIAHGVQSCIYPYTIDPVTCLPPDSDVEKKYFECPIDEVYKK